MVAGVVVPLATAAADPPRVLCTLRTPWRLLWTGASRLRPASLSWATPLTRVQLSAARGVPRPPCRRRRPHPYHTGTADAARVSRCHTHSAAQLCA